MKTDLHSFGPFVRRFLLEEVVTDRNLSLNTQRSYRDTLRLLFGFLAEHHVAEPAQVMTEQITAALVRDFLAHLESQRGNSVATRNQRLASISTAPRRDNSTSSRTLHAKVTTNSLLPNQGMGVGSFASPEATRYGL